MKGLQTPIVLAATLTVAASATAHHSFVAVFDPEDPVELEGTVTEIEWMNPHVWFYVDVSFSDGRTENWGFEMGSPNALVRRGWNHLSLQVGQTVTVAGVRARDDSRRAAVRRVTLASGEALFGGQDESR